MRAIQQSLDCDGRNFVYAAYEFSRTDDKASLEKLRSEGLGLAKHVNPTLARDASRRRDYETIERNSVAGVIAEFCWRHWLRTRAIQEGVKVNVESTIFESFDNHVDISVTYPDWKSKTIEVRSSFPYTGLKNAVCKVFDIIGWYKNPVKTKEIHKDYYVRVLFPFRSIDLWDKLGEETFSAFLCGGATKNMLEGGQYSKDKAFVPYDDIDAMLSSQKGTYRVVEPIINAYDTIGITSQILRGA